MAFESYYKLVKYKTPLEQIPFYVEDVSGQANIVSITKSHTNAPTLTIETSTDRNTWTTLGQTSTTPLTLSVPANGKVYLRCNATRWTNGANYGSQNSISSTSVLNVGGNIMSLLYGSNFIGKTSFSSGTSFNLKALFIGVPIVDASQLVLPATTLADGCYFQMFYNCTSLTSAPALPATTLAASCYSGMFNGCTSLTTAPTLPATTMQIECYGYMFNGCTSLTTAPTLPATTLAQSCYTSMFQRCTSLTAAPALPATTLASSCYYYMFANCTALTTAPALNATTLAGYCYYYMFQNCSSLNSVTCLATDISASGCTTGWLTNVAASGTFTKAASMSSWTTGANGIPSGWTVQDAQ